MKKFSFVIFFVSSFVSPIYAAEMLTIDLQIGDSGPQVRILQQILNRDAETAVAEYGDGSKGFETEYFGALTRSAAIRFQEKYRNEVLTPAGLASGTGFVGSFTRTALNKLLNPSAPSTQKSVNVSPIVVNTYINPYSNANFLSTSSLEALKSYLPSGFATSSFSATSTAAREAAFSTASNAILSILKAKANIVLNTSTGTLATSSPLTAAKPGAVPPRIFIVQKPTSLNDAMIISGTGIAKENSIYTSLGYLEKVKPTGTSTLSFKLIDLPGFSYYANVPKEYLASTTVMVWVYNENGLSNILGPFNVNF